MNNPVRTPSHTGGIGHLPTNVGLPKSKKEEIQQTWSTYEHVDEELRLRGFIPPEKPVFTMPQITEKDLLTEDNTHFTTMFSHVLAWHNYAKDLYARVRSMLLELENEMDDIARVTRKNIKDTGKKMTSAELEDEIQSDANYKKLKIKAQEYQQRKILLDSMVDSLERSLRVVSRQVEINRQELEGENIKNNMPRRGGPPRDFRR